MKKLIARNFRLTIVKEQFRTLNSQCRNCENLLSHFFDKNFVKATSLLKSRFHEIFFWWNRICAHFGTVLCCISQCVGEPQRGNYGNLLSHILGKNFVKITFLNTKESIWRMSFSLTLNFLFFHTVGTKHLLFLEKYFVKSIYCMIYMS